MAESRSTRALRGGNGGRRLYYFNNDASRLCYTFTVSGRCTLDEKTGVMALADGKGSLGQSVKSAKDLDAAAGDADLVAAAIRPLRGHWGGELTENTLASVRRNRG